MFLAQMSVFELGILAVIAVVFIVVFAFLLVQFRLWLQAFLCRVPISLAEIMGMRFRGVDPTPLVKALIMSQQASLTISRAEVERVYSQGVDPVAFVSCQIAAQRWEMTLSPAKVEQAYLQGVDALEIVRILGFAHAPQHDIATSANAPRSAVSEEAEQRRFQLLRDLKRKSPETTFQELVDAYLKQN